MSGPVRFGVSNGLEYQMRLFGPLAHEECMRQEQRLAAYLRWLAPRIESKRAAPKLAA